MKTKLMLEYLIEQITKEKPQCVVDGKVLVVKVNPKFQGLVVGKKGKTFAAINVLCWYCGLKHDGGPVSMRLLPPEERFNYLPIPNGYGIADLQRIVEIMQGLLKFIVNAEVIAEKDKITLIINEDPSTYEIPDLASALVLLTKVVAQSLNTKIKCEALYGCQANT